MTHKQFDNDEQLEQMLKNAPKLTDDRSKEEVLKRLLADARLQDNIHLQEAMQQPTDSKVLEEQEQSIAVQENESMKPVKQRRKSKLPIFSSIAAVFVLSVAGYVFLSNNNPVKDEANAPPENFSTMQEDQAVTESENADGVMKANIGAEHARMLSLRTSVYEEDLANAVVFRIGLPGGNADSIPMTYVIPNEKITADFGKKKPTTLQMYEKYAPQIDEEALGFANYHPYKGELKEEGETLVHVLPEKNDYDVASASVTKYLSSLKDTFTDSEYKAISLKNADGTPYEFSQAGEPSEPIQLTKDHHYNYYLYTEENGTEYLSPDFHQTYPTVTEALIAMRDKRDDIYVPVVPENVTYTVKEEEGGVVITFDAPLDLTTMDAVRATQLIEAMMLTASSFDKKLRLDNVVQESWEGFDLTKFLPMPVGANKQTMQ
ncbi:RNA polymerase subunit sigma [Lysinibacillus sp. CD3-6]|uniref:RNA polymerase subunit sigma n=1 Tax=Lysinibacillus sp. CD3-6 TaxID=2892541 RepID=UPI00116AF2E0|nr:RNA polymerase subunit sigma [Lysinibacillus sp. CD3-6]UED81603.1 RNA polymerase subunit sigma [Lysinibacillus sp. CD3-6]